ncbi:hypothetical protein ACH5RR_041037 [Cinchona calisaya]|uniref:Uncharacterized protein n=1 Tax=Cinchona calisaya TaxID=153742 RepID=A0ABD2XVU0_9GENT
MMHHEAIKMVESSGRNSTKQGGVEGKIPSKKAPKVLRVLTLPTSKHHLAGSCRYQQRERNNQMETATNYGSWPRQRPRRRGDRSKRESLDNVFSHSWATVSRSRGRSAPCPRIRIIYSLFILLQSDLAGQQSQFATENKTASEHTFVRFFSTKHGSLRITVGRWLPKETLIQSAPRPGGIYLIPITRRGSL